MNRHGHAQGGRWALGFIGLVLIGLLSACEGFWNSPEDRAQTFIEALIVAPAATAKLRDIANIPSEREPEDLLQGLAARVALDFLRAKQAQGVKLNFSHGDVRRTDATHRVVAIRVTDASNVAAVNNDIGFQVYLESQEQNQWRIVRVTQ